MPIIVSEFLFQKNLQIQKLSYGILNFIIHMLDVNRQFYTKMTPTPLSILF